MHEESKEEQRGLSSLTAATRVESYLAGLLVTRVYAIYLCLRASGFMKMPEANDYVRLQ